MNKTEKDRFLKEIENYEEYEIMTAYYRIPRLREISRIIRGLDMETYYQDKINIIKEIAIKNNYLKAVK